jgi:hypothetical protein
MQHAERGRLRVHELQFAASELELHRLPTHH